MTEQKARSKPSRPVPRRQARSLYGGRGYRYRHSFPPERYGFPPVQHGGDATTHHRCSPWPTSPGCRPTISLWYDDAVLTETLKLYRTVSLCSRRYVARIAIATARGTLRNYYCTQQRTHGGRLLYVLGEVFSSTLIHCSNSASLAAAGMLRSVLVCVYVCMCGTTCV